MGISIFSFQIIGGVFLLFISYEMVFEKRLVRKKNTAKKIIDENEIKNNAVFPVSIPLVAGPSAITLSVLISEDFNFSTLDFLSKNLSRNNYFIYNLFNNFVFKLYIKTIESNFNNHFAKNLWFNIRSFVSGIYNTWI